MNKILENSKLSAMQKKRRRQRRLIGAIVGVFLLIIVGYLFLVQSGAWLVRDTEFKHVPWVVVLDGQSANMERSDYAMRLLAEERADSILVLGRRIFRSYHTTDFYVEDMAHHEDFDSSRIFVCRHNDASTVEEALSIIPWLKTRGADTVLLLTATPATRRVSEIFKTLGGSSPVFITADLHDSFYNTDSWFSERESRKWWFREMAAYVQMKMDLWFVDTLEADSVTAPRFFSLADEFSKLSKRSIPEKIKAVDSLQTKQEKIMTDSLLSSSLISSSLSSSSSDSSVKLKKTESSSSQLSKKVENKK